MICPNICIVLHKYVTNKIFARKILWKFALFFLLGPLPPAIMDQLAAAAAASYVAQPGPQGQQQQQPQPQRPPNLVDTAVQTDVTTVVQSKQVFRKQKSVLPKIKIV